MRLTFTSFVLCVLLCTEAHASTYCDSLSTALITYAAQNPGNESLDNLVWSLDNTFGYSHYDSASSTYISNDAPYWYGQITGCGLSFPTIINCAQADSVLQHFYAQYPQWRYESQTAIWTTYLNSNGAANGYWNSSQSWTFLLSQCGYSYPVPDTPLTQCDSLTDAIGLYTVQFPSGSDFYSFTDELNNMWGYTGNLSYWRTVYATCGDSFPTFINCTQADTVMNHFYATYPQYAIHAPAFLWAGYLNQNNPTPTDYQSYSAQDWMLLLGSCGISYPAPDTLANYCDSLQVADSLFIYSYPNGGSANQFAFLLNNELGASISYTGWVGILNGCGLPCPHTMNCTFADSVMTVFKVRNPADSSHAPANLWMGYLNSNNAQGDNSWYTSQDWMTMLSCCGISYPTPDTLGNYCDSLSAAVSMYNNIYPNGSQSWVFVNLMDETFNSWGYDSAGVYVNNSLQSWYSQTNGCGISCPHLVSCTVEDSLWTTFYGTFPQYTTHAPAFVWTAFLNSLTGGQISFTTQDWLTLLGCCSISVPTPDTVNTYCDSMQVAVNIYNQQNPNGSNLSGFTSVLNTYLVNQHYDSASGQMVGNSALYWLTKLQGCGISCPSIVNCSVVSSLMSSFYSQYPQYDSAAPDIFWSTYLNENNAGADNFGNGWTYTPDEWRALFICCNITPPAKAAIGNHCDTINTIMSAIPGLGTYSYNIYALVNALNEMYGWQHYDSVSGQMQNNNLAYWLPQLAACGYTCSQVVNCDSINAAMNELSGYIEGTGTTYSPIFTVLYLGIRFPNYNLDGNSWGAVLSCCSPPSVNNDTAMSYCEEVEILRIALQYALPNRSCLPAWVYNYMLTQFEPSFVNLKDTTVGLLCADLSSCKMTCLTYCDTATMSSCDSAASVNYVYQTLLRGEGATVDTNLLDNVFGVLYGYSLPYATIMSEISNCAITQGIITSINYSAQNVSYSDSAGQYFVDMDVFVRDSPAGLLYSQSAIYLQYDSALGSSLVGSGAITASKGQVIDSPYYSMALSDSTPQLLKIQISHSSSVSTLPTIPTNQQLCHLRVNLSGINLANVAAAWDTVQMAGRSEYKQTVNGLEYPYDIIRVSGLSTLRSGNISAQLTNVSYTGASAGYLTFDVQITTDGDPLADADVKIAVNTDNFGTSPSFNCTMSSLDASYYSMVPSISAGTLDLSFSSTSGITYNVNASDPLATITSYTTVATCSLTVANCCVMASGPYLNLNAVSGDYANFSENTDDSDSNNWFYYEDGTIPYGTGSVSGAYNNGGSNICPNSSPTPIISTLDPLNITAGTYSVLTISGVGFGCSPGQVLFPNADTGGTGMMHTQAPDIQTWGDDQITVWVPSIQDGPGNGRPAGSGQILVVTAANDTSNLSSDALTIPYAISNYRDASNNPIMPGFKNQDSVGGYTFTPDSSINPVALGTITRAMNDWNCRTGVNFVMGASAPNQTVQYNHINSILMGIPGGDLLALTIVSVALNINCTSGSVVVAPVQDIDMIIDSTANFYLPDTATPAPGTYSLLYGVRHEFGHACLQAHVDDMTDLMYYSYGVGVTALPISYNNELGVEYILTDIDPNYLANCFNTSIRQYPIGCAINGISDVADNPFDVSAYPNPFGDDITVTANLSQAADVKVSIFDVLGQLVALHDYGEQSGTFEESVNASGLSSGMYVMQVGIGQSTFKIKLIKK